MVYLKDSNLKVQVSKEILKDILNELRFHIDLKASKYWKKELIDASLENDKLVYKLKDIKTLSISNGLHPELPTYKYNCIRYFLNEDNSKFIFQLGGKINDKIETNDLKHSTQLNLFV